MSQPSIPATDTGTTTTREVHLIARPSGAPTGGELAVRTVPRPVPGEGQALVRNTWMSVEPYMRGRMDDAGPSYIPPFALNESLDGAAVGEVVESRSDALPVGSIVLHLQGWREHAIVDAETATVLDPDQAPPETHLGVLGTPGLTAYVALTEIAPVREGDVVLISSAAGTVGTVAGAVARKRGARTVIGVVGSAEKADLIVDRGGFDAAIDRTAAPLAEQLATVAPDGVDVYLDAVGGDHLQAAIGQLNDGGRVAAVGAIAEYNATEPPPGPNNLYEIVKKRLTVRGILVLDHLDQLGEWVSIAAPWVQDGTLPVIETVRDGLDQAPQALLDLLSGDVRGKVLVRLAP